ncbi:hypothetical protein TNIN_321531 [Trichonephila inaurata madagascariensis]|uniref:Uncharacterized protein n=1 Tax=Trichonephila inaurata madagascariensis TaxID=2747483 RepID=A0A8X6YH04_9ARAC|nr:hypothetical protein TNIN_118111 [Trichonephila inaurata madagascariensis]GFY71847.1 hypothetical protein TNIN_321531 [Trichonephila inaurata madagascariensis]
MAGHPNERWSGWVCCGALGIGRNHRPPILRRISAIFAHIFRTSKKGYAFLSKKVMRGERGERRAHHLPPAHRPPLGCGRRGQLRPPRIQQENEQVRILIQCDFSVQGLAK